MPDNELENFHKYFDCLSKNNPEEKPLIPNSDEDKYALARAKSEIKKLESEKKELKKQLDSMSKLLSQPLQDISKISPEFKINYEKIMENYALELITQRAFKELAIQYGSKLGISKDSVFIAGIEKEIDVVENRNNPAHATVANSSSVISARLSTLKSIVYKKVASLRKR